MTFKNTKQYVLNQYANYEMQISQKPIFVCRISARMKERKLLEGLNIFVRLCIPRWRQCHPSLMLLIITDVSMSLLNKAPQTYFIYVFWHYRIFPKNNSFHHWLELFSLLDLWCWVHCFIYHVTFCDLITK